MFHGFCQYTCCQSFINSLGTAGFVFHLKFCYLIGQPLDGGVDLIILVSNLAYCLKKRVLVSSWYSAQGRAPRTVGQHLCYMSKASVIHKQFRVDQLWVPEAQQVGIKGEPGT